MNVKVMAKGVLSWVPGVQGAFFDRCAAGGTGSASYCYGVWVKHLALLAGHGMRFVPRTVLELGPGASIGTGAAALLSGAQRYIAIDAVAHARSAANRAVFAELVALFAARAPRPTAGFPPFDHLLDERLFPSSILDEAQLRVALAPERVARLEACMDHGTGPAHCDEIRYFTWDHPQPVSTGSVDLAFSHVVMNQVTDLAQVYGRLGRWVVPGGWMSHQIDLTCLGTADEWNGHRAYGDFAWKVIAGHRPYFVNREPLSTHLRLMEEAGFDVVHLERGCRPGGLGREQLAPRWRGMPDEDLATQTGFVIARRRA